MYVLFPIAVCLFFFVLTQKRTKKVKKFVRKFGSKLPTVDAAYRYMLFFCWHVVPETQKRTSAGVTTISEQTSVSSYRSIVFASEVPFFRLSPESFLE